MRNTPLLRNGLARMSNTKYARDKILRLDEKDRAALYWAVMHSIQVVSASQFTLDEPEPRHGHELATLRSLLDRLEEL